MIAPRWARLCDAASLLLILVAVWILLGGGGRYILAGMTLSLRSAALFFYAAGGILAIRHLLAPRPSAIDRLKALDAAIAARPVLAAALRPFLATRVTVLAVGFFAVVTIGFPSTIGFRVSNDPLQNLPARFDAGWYGDILLDGYAWDGTVTEQRSIAFFPAAPMAARPLGWLFGTREVGAPRERRMLRGLWAMVVVSLAAFFWALHYLVRLGRDLLSEEQAANSALLLAVYPFAVFYSAPYTEALFLLGAVGACFHFGRREWLAASLWGLLVGLTRPNGCLLSIPLALLAWQQLRAEGLATRLDGPLVRATAPRLLVAAMPGLSMLAFTVYLQQLTGVWFAWARTHGAWGRTFQGIDPFVAAWSRLSQEPFVQVIQNNPYTTLNALGLLFALALLWPTYRRLGLPWAAFVLVTITGPALAGGVLSMGRLTSTLFPLFLALAAVLPPRAVPACTGAFALLQGLCAALFFTWRDLY